MCEGLKPVTVKLLFIVGPLRQDSNYFKIFFNRYAAITIVLKSEGDSELAKHQAYLAFFCLIRITFYSQDSSPLL